MMTRIESVVARLRGFLHATAKVTGCGVASIRPKTPILPG
jgi:hypothetical protein